MYPHTRLLVDALSSPDEMPVEEPAMHDSPDDPKILQLRLKRKYQLGMIKKMLEDGGYGELAKMTTIGKKSYDIEE